MINSLPVLGGVDEALDSKDLFAVERINWDDLVLRKDALGEPCPQSRFPAELAI
jgi:hypothetical protein